MYLPRVLNFGAKKQRKKLEFDLKYHACLFMPGDVLVSTHFSSYTGGAFFYFHFSYPACIHNLIYFIKMPDLISGLMAQLWSHGKELEVVMCLAANAFLLVR